jgi:hypothetical protein
VEEYVPLNARHNVLPRIRRVTHSLLTLALVGCCAYLLWREAHRSGVAQPPAPDSERAALPADEALHTSLDVKSIGGTYELPEGENYGVIALLHFEDGKFRGRQDAWQITGEPKGTRVVSYQLFWGKGPGGGTQVAVVTRTPTSGSRSISRKVPLLSGLNGHSLEARSAPSEEVRGYRVLGHIMSSEIRPGRSGSVGRADNDIENRQAVAVIGVKTFSTSEQARDCLFAREPADP